MNQIADSKAHAEHMTNYYDELFKRPFFAVALSDLGIPNFENHYLVSDRVDLVENLDGDGLEALHDLAMQAITGEDHGE